jgi:hypothetical protein
MAPPPLLSFYLHGREMTENTFAVEDFDPMVIAKSIRSLEEIRGVCYKVVAADVATDAHDGTKDEWIAEHEDACEEDGVSVEDAYAAYCKGYIDEGSISLESEVVNALAELAEEDTAVETPSAKRIATANPGSRPSYAAYFEDGIEDCGNTFDATDFDDEIEAAVKAFKRHRQDITKLAAAVVGDYWKAMQDDGKAAWLEQNADDVKENGLKPDRAYEFWADGWKTQAQKYVAEAIVKHAEDE